DDELPARGLGALAHADDAEVTAALCAAEGVLDIEALAVVLDGHDDALAAVDERDLRLVRAGVLRDVPERLPDDADHSTFNDRLELALRTGLLHLHLETGLTPQVVHQTRERDRQVQCACLALPERGHVLADIRERGARVARG